MISRLALWSALVGLPVATSAQNNPPPPAPAVSPTTPAVTTTPTVAATPAVVAPAASPAPCCLIPAGTIIEIAIDDPLDSKTSKIGQQFAIHLTTPLQLSDGNFVIPAGTRGVGEVIHAAKAHMGGKAGELILIARHLDVGGVQIPLRGFHLGGQGKDNSGLVMAAVISVGIAGMLISGGEKRVPAGSIATAKIAVDTTLPPIPQPQAATVLPAVSTTTAASTTPAAVVPAANTRENDK
ncbi:MAG: hypothetical protein V4475_16040 [Pseudomonadota bacterium]